MRTLTMVAIAAAGVFFILACALGYLDYWIKEIFP